ncbi:uncharacterized protein LOC123500936 [Portunus trituberculatus]|uniref:uncharacterized protein LOC123500936 n=1 Tax=Portunus trituberculatus TaxID=210409 RepID=UPI001E1CC25F|nr:uncharacterized protein LOC123500936 [Portunus trituberculatus]
MGYTSHVSQRVARAKSALARLYRFRDLATGLKLHLVKALVLPILSYPPVPLHALSRTAISRLQKVQNSALRFAFGTRWDDFTTSASLHEAASLPALNVRLHEMATKVWERMEDEGWDQYRELQALHEETPDRQHAWFPRSLLQLQEGQPEPRYRNFIPASSCHHSTCELRNAMLTGRGPATYRETRDEDQGDDGAADQRRQGTSGTCQD